MIEIAGITYIKSNFVPNLTFSRFKSPELQRRMLVVGTGHDLSLQQ